MDWFKYNPLAWRSDTLELTLAQDGAYHRLVDEYMISRRALPRSTNALARIVGISEMEFLEDIKAAVIDAYFVEDGEVLRHEYCEKVLAHQDAMSNKRADAGTKGGNARWTAPKKKPKKKEPVPPDGDPPLGPDGKPKRRASQLADTWEPNDKHLIICVEEEFSDGEVDWIVGQFRDRARATGKTYKDWDAAFRTWIRSSYTRDDITARRKANGSGAGAKPFRPGGGEGSGGARSVGSAGSRWAASRKDEQ